MRLISLGKEFEVDHYEDEDGNVVENPTQFESYSLVVKGISPYKGTTSRSFTIVDPYDLREASLDLDRGAFIWTGDPVSLSGKASVVDYNGNVLSEGKDYELVYSHEVEDEDGDWMTVELDGAPTELGYYYVCARAIKGNEAGYTNQTWTSGFQIIDPYDIGIFNTMEWAGSSTVPSVDDLPEVSLSRYDYETGRDIYLTQGVEFELDHYEGEDGHTVQSPTSPGHYAAVYRGISPYKGTRSIGFTIVDEHSLNFASINLPTSSFVWTGSPISLSSSAQVVDFAGNKLVEGRDYRLVYYEVQTDEHGEENLVEVAGLPANEGDYYVAARAIDGNASGYKGETSTNFSIYGKNNTSSYHWWITWDKTNRVLSVDDLMAVHMHYESEDGDEAVLAHGEGFKFDHLESSDGVVVQDPAPGMYYACYTGIDPYYGTKKARVWIVDVHDLSYGLAELTASEFAWTGEPVDLAGKVTVTDFAGSGLVCGDDYDLVYYRATKDAYGAVSFTPLDGAPSEVGDYAVAARAKEGNENGYYDEAIAQFSIIERTGTPLQGATVTVADQTYTGEALTPKVTVTLNGTKLTRGTDYTVEYQRNTNAGTATVIVTGMGDYSGTASQTFRILPRSVEDGAIAAIADQTYSGEAIEPAVAVTLNGAQLGADDFDVAYTQNTNVGQAAVTITAKATYTGGAVEPRVTVTVGSESLVEGTDFKVVSYQNNVNAGDEATVTLEGLGKYKGTKTVGFVIVKAASSVSLAAQSKTYTGKALVYSGKVTKSGSTGKVTYKYYSNAKCTKEVAAKNVKNAGTYYVKGTLAADANHESAVSAAAKFTVAKAANPLVAKAVARTARYADVKSKTPWSQAR